MFLWLLLWMVLYASSILLYNFSYAFTRDVLIYNAQVKPAAWLASLTLPDMNVTHNETCIMVTGISMEIRRGCDGMEAWLLLMTALLVFPMKWRRRCRAMLLGTGLIFFLNLVRIVSMFHVIVRRPEWFDIAHGLIWQSIMVLAVALFILVQLDPTPQEKTKSS